MTEKIYLARSYVLKKHYELENLAFPGVPGCLHSAQSVIDNKNYIYGKIPTVFFGTGADGTYLL